MGASYLTMPVEATALGWTAGCSCPGAAHRRSGMPCQDAHALWSGVVAGMPCLVAAVADGHGDARHDRSQVGAVLAVQAAVEVAREFCRTHSQKKAPIALKHDFKTHFPRKAGQRWREAVRNDAQTRDDAIFTRYGTTLLVALAVPEVLLVGQIGDGTLLWVTDNTCEVLLRPPPMLLGTETHSLCSTDASQLWQTAVFERTVAGLALLTTDGLSDALGDEPTTLEPFARSLRQCLQKFGPVQVTLALPTWLDHYSAHGSGDDMTLALLWLEASTAGPMATATSHLSEETSHEPEHRPAGDRGSAAEHADCQAETR